MDYIKIGLYAALFFISVVLWNNWEHEKRPAKVTQQVSVLENNATIESHEGPDSAVDALSADETKPASKAKGKIVHIENDVLALDIDSVGGKIVKASLLKYPESLEDKNKPFILLNSEENQVYYAESGLTHINGSNSSHLNFYAEKDNYRLNDNQDTLRAKLTGTDSSGIKIEKTFVLHKGSYEIQVEHNVLNHSGKIWKGNLFTSLSRNQPVESGSSFMSFHSYLGAAISTQKDPYEKVNFKEMDKKQVNQSSEGGWLAMIQHYFVSAWVPPSNETNRYFSEAKNGVYSIGSIGPVIMLEPGNTAKVEAKLYLGPKVADKLKAVAPHLDLTIDYGYLWFIAVGIFWLLAFIHKFIGNWGWSIVLVTLVIKLAFYRLSASSYKSMANLRKLQPKIEAIKKRFENNKQELSKAIMELYRKEKVNPLGGCLPILIQIPVFIALYWVLVESVELRQAPFILWIHDLSLKDPFYVMPIIMGITMFIQQRLSPAPPDPTQAKVMMLMPVIFTVFFLNFPAGLVLYWLVNNVLSILQQWYVTKKVESAN